MNNIWFMSDPHYWHKNIAGPKCSVWKDGYRNFDSVEEMSRTIVKNINKCVQEDDILYCLGDWSFGGKNNIWNFRKQLRCKNIHLILGNHDDHIRKNIQINAFIKEYDNEDNPIILDFSESKSDFDEPCNAQDIFSSVNEVLIATHGNITFFMSHYKHAIWYGSHKGVIHLYGHSHGSAEDWVIGKSMDVGIDNAYKLLGEYRPFHINEIYDIMKKREIDFSDHHNSKTNLK